MLEVGLAGMRVGNRRFPVCVEIYRPGEDTLLTRCESVYVGYDMENRVSRPITEKMRALLLGES